MNWQQAPLAELQSRHVPKGSKFQIQTIPLNNLTWHEKITKGLW